MKHFSIPLRTPRPPHVCRTVYLPKELEERVDTVSAGLDCSFSAFVREALRYTLDALDEEKQQKNGQP